MTGHAVVALIAGLVLAPIGLLMLVFRERFDDFNLRTTPKWMKPPGGGVFAPSQRPYRLRGNAIAGTILMLTGTSLTVLAVVFRHKQ